jgi:hypothetical protein
MKKQKASTSLALAGSHTTPPEQSSGQIVAATSSRLGLFEEVEA